MVTKLESLKSIRDDKIIKSPFNKNNGGTIKNK